ncbi:hypothetical protein KZZ52_23765 [Dactylosporangium sp. AC04546]|uniref:hypothetical protein n=1 Tax=Dactylosporangium sp. AC04546 TaxID=2862460 RepID=UPI001EDFE9AD|nr:hypothetical protein [Dactylosporangium sp. AC04546]WVK88295.1 hypothetical protein KZZ52_23765 [Dactylosporangium sp. AC04546]
MTTSEEHRVATLLRAAAVPGPRVDIARAIRDGRRRRRRRQTAVAATTAGLAVGVTALGVPWLGADRAVDRVAPPLASAPVSVAAPAALSCAAERLPMPIDGPVAVALSVDPTGRHVLGEIGGGEENNHVVLWSAGSATVLPAAARHPGGVNAAGMVVGTDGAGAGWLWRGGGLVAVTTPAGYDRVLLYAINGRGEIAGTAWGPGERHRAVVWTAEHPDQYQFAAPEGSSATGITDDGTVFGELGARPYRWPGGPLALPAGVTTGTVEAVRGQWAIGTVPGEQHMILPVRWNLATGEVSRLPFGSADAVTRAGEVLATDGAPALLSADGSVRRLPGLPSGGTYQATGLSDDARTVVGSVFEQSRYSPIVWRCN